jgi:pyruvate/2-oxoglutarate dehydrogenase complex dihydrolipoamide dehydrogenase (E3) component
VTIVEGADRILGHNEPEAAAVVATVLADDGIQVRSGVKVIAVRSGDDGFEIELSDGSQVSAERLLVATGRRANAEGLGIESAGAVVEGGAVQVDGLMRAGEGLWAFGDVTGQSMLTQVAEYQGRIAIEDILGGKPRPADYSAMPAVTFTDPELASVGLTESEARATGNEITVVVKDIQATFRGWLHRTGNKGLIKLVADRDENRLVGATVVGPSAGETIGFLHVAVARQVPLEELVDLIYPFPTFYGGIGEALGAYGRGIVRVLDPATPPLFEDPKLIN